MTIEELNEKLIVTLEEKVKLLEKQVETLERIIALEKE